MTRLLVVLQALRPTDRVTLLSGIGLAPGRVPLYSPGKSWNLTAPGLACRFVYLGNLFCDFFLNRELKSDNASCKLGTVVIQYWDVFFKTF